jgi:hypothetical protein
MKELVARFEILLTTETESLIQGVKAAGGRARKSTLEMEKC